LHHEHQAGKAALIYAGMRQRRTTSQNWGGLLIGIYRHAQDGISETNMKDMKGTIGEWSGVEYFIASDRLSNGVIPSTTDIFFQDGWLKYPGEEGSKQAREADRFLYVLNFYFWYLIRWISSPDIHAVMVLFACNHWLLVSKHRAGHTECSNTSLASAWPLSSVFRTLVFHRLLDLFHRLD